MSPGAAVASEEIFAGMVLKRLHIPDISHHCFGAAVPGNCHDFVQSRMVCRGAGNETGPQ